jgi:probable HAF family extracellular repeat protein
MADNRRGALASKPHPHSEPALHAGDGGETAHAGALRRKQMNGMNMIRSGKMNTANRTWTAIAMLCLGSAAHAQQTAWQVTITDLALLPGGTYASAYAINDTGKIVGMATDASGAYKTVEWVNGVISVIPDFSSALCVPEDLNDAGESVGQERISGFFSYALYWDSQNNLSALPGLANGASNLNRAHAINASGQIVGMAQEGGPTNFFGHAVVWLQNSLQTDLGFMGGGTYSEAFGINDLGAVVGVAAIANTNQHAFLWQNGTYSDLSAWVGGGVSSKAYAINHQGDIVGLNASVAALWRNGSVQALTMPPGLSAYTPAIDINDAGDIIATAMVAYPIEVGVLWRNGTPISLGTLPGGTISRARRLNAAGEVVGEAKAADGYFHAVKWTITAVQTTFCFGDGSGNACPCGNSGAAGNGCAHSLSPIGANLIGSGSASLASDTLVLSGSNMPNSSALYFQGTLQLNGGLGNAFGDGLRCAGGTVIRLGTKANASGASQYPAALDLPVSLKGLVTTPGTRTYQAWYRNAASFCTASTFNLTNGLSIAWGS